MDTPDHLERGEMLCTVNYGGHPARAVVPRSYTHLAVDKGSVRGGGPFKRWKIGYRSATTCTELKKTATGKHPDVLQYDGPATEAVLNVVGKGYARLVHHGRDGGRSEVTDISLGPFRGRIELPGPGLIEVDCLVDWSLRIAD
ncbi:hypothetical protein GCM10009801_10040 [Streptomyces albiaxialis]|uniref:Uncharacterized protein n=1 Tax=Streptomyces albiaxialis TaxID=329523 RepID=A0ABN2VLK2_9ACTN